MKASMRVVKSIAGVIALEERRGREAVGIAEPSRVCSQS
jgi:hypothetical protein